MLSLLRGFLGKSFFDRADHAKGDAAAEPDEATLSGLTEGLDIDSAIMAHQNWKFRLEAYLGGRSSEDLRPEIICFDDRYDLGRWIHSSGRARLGRFAGFTRLVEHHRMFHFTASNVVSLARAGKKAEAEKMLNTLYEQKSAAVVGALEELKQLSHMGGAK